MIFTFRTYRLFGLLLFFLLSCAVVVAQQDLEQQFEEAQKWEEQDLLDTAVVILLDLIEEAEAEKAYELLIKAQIQLALVFEKSGHLSSCKKQLDAAQQNILKYGDNTQQGLVVGAEILLF